MTRIQSGKSGSLIAQVREGDKDKKRRLPVVCFSGEFSSRADDALFEHSGFIVLDFDHVNVDATKTALATDDYVHSCWVSPSGDGIKALVQITNTGAVRTCHGVWQKLSLCAPFQHFLFSDVVGCHCFVKLTIKPTLPQSLTITQDVSRLHNLLNWHGDVVTETGRTESKQIAKPKDNCSQVATTRLELLSCLYRAIG